MNFHQPYIVYCIVLLSARKEVNQNKMLKITIEVNENKDKNNCTVKMINPKDLKKSTENEQKTCAMVINKITESLKELQD